VRLPRSRCNELPFPAPRAAARQYVRRCWAKAFAEELTSFELGTRRHRLPDSIEPAPNGQRLEEDHMASKKQKRQAAATGTNSKPKPKPKKKTSRGK
jgi:hypothetical protein